MPVCRPGGYRRVGRDVDRGRDHPERPVLATRGRSVRKAGVRPRDQSLGGAGYGVSIVAIDDAERTVGTADAEVTIRASTTRGFAGRTGRRHGPSGRGSHREPRRVDHHPARRLPALPPTSARPSSSSAPSCKRDPAAPPSSAPTVPPLPPPPTPGRLDIAAPLRRLRRFGRTPDPEPITPPTPRTSARCAAVHHNPA